MLNRIKAKVARLKSRAKGASGEGLDLRGLGPIHVCACGSRLFKVGCMFEDSEISLWFVDAQCAECDALVTVPTPVDEDD